MKLLDQAYPDLVEIVSEWRECREWRGDGIGGYYTLTDNAAQVLYRQKYVIS
jgi:hypothetical protein